MIIEYNQHPDDSESKDDSHKGNSTGGSVDSQSENLQKDDPENSGTLILDATCAPSHIAYPQDINLLNEARLRVPGTGKPSREIHESSEDNSEGI